MCTHILPFLISMSGVPCKSRRAMVTNCHPEIDLFWYQLLPNFLHMMSTLCSSSSLIPYDIFSHLRQFKTFQIPWMGNRIIIFLIINLCCSQIIVSLPTIIYYHFIYIKTWSFAPWLFLLHAFWSTGSKLYITKYSYTLLDIIAVINFHKEERN